MNPLERTEPIQAAIRDAIFQDRSELWTAMPAVVAADSPDGHTVSVQVTIMGKFPNGDGTYSDKPRAQLIYCPLQFQQGGGATLTFPVKQGDEGIVLFAARCIDSWWQNGGVQPQSEIRLHSIADGMFIPGIRSNPRKLANVSTTSAQLRSDDGQCYVEVVPGTHAINIITTKTVNITAAQNVEISGNAGIDLMAPTTVVHGNLQVTGTTFVQDIDIAGSESGGGPT